MPVNALPIITEGKELNSANRNNDNLNLNMKINYYNTPLNGQLLPENEHSRDLASFIKLDEHEDIISNKVEESVSCKLEEEVSRKPEEADSRKPYNSDSCKPEYSDSRKPDNSYSCKPDNSDSRKPEDYDSRKPDHSDSCKPDNSNSRKLEDSDLRKPEDSDSGKPEESVSRKPDEADSDKPGETDSGKPDKADSGKPDETDSGKPDKADLGKPDKTDSGKPDETDSGKPDKADLGKPDEADSGKPDKADSGKPDKADSGKPDKAVSRKPEEAVPRKPVDSVSCMPEEAVSLKPEKTNPQEDSPHMPRITISCPEEDNVSLKLDDDESFKLLKTVNNVQTVHNNESIGTDINDQNNNISKATRLKIKKSQPWVTRLTKKELDALLPSRSHFSCHDKALREAGYIPEEIVKRKTERKERRKIFRDKLFKTRCGQHILDNNISNVLTSTHKEPSDTLFDSDLNDKSTLRHRKKPDELPKVEHKALTEYLRYVKENPNEYLEHLSRRQTCSDNWAVRNLIKTAMVFQRGHHGVPYTTPAVRASHSLNPRFADPGLWQQLNKDFTSKRSVTMDSSISKLPAEKEKETKVDSDEPKTDYEKALSRAERWAKTVSTAQFLRARQEALREVEEEDTDVTKWWINMKKCNYIRTKSSLSD